ncbi:MAG: fumarylacetoacetate hydrolase family protein [Pseudomonadota bacterium]
MDRATTAGEAIWARWQAGEVMDALSAGIVPRSRAEGYAAQAVLEQLSTSSRAGWKIAATSQAGQQHIGVAGPLAGRIFTETVHEPAAVLSIATNRMRVAEPEFAFRFGTAMSPRNAPYAVEEVLEAVADLHLTLELPDSRFTDFATVGEACLIADNACARDLIVGPAVGADWRAVDLSRHPVTARIDGRYERAGSGSNVLGDPRAALAWCVNELSGLGIEISAGEFITTGTAVPPLALEPGDHVFADFGLLGSIEASVIV